MKKGAPSHEVYGGDKESDKEEADKANMIIKKCDTDKSLLLHDLRFYDNEQPAERTRHKCSCFEKKDLIYSKLIIEVHVDGRG